MKCNIILRYNKSVKNLFLTFNIYSSIFQSAGEIGNFCQLMIVGHKVEKKPQKWVTRPLLLGIKLLKYKVY